METRCTHCDTLFRVSPADLSAARGWVRCGVCGDPFDALDALAEARAESPTPDGETPAARPAPASSDGAAGASDAAASVMAGPPPVPLPEAVAPAVVEPASEASLAVLPVDEADGPGPKAPVEPALRAVAPDAAVADGALAVASLDPLAAADDKRITETAEPGLLVREAHEIRRRPEPGGSGAWFALALLLLLGLALQGLLYEPARVTGLYPPLVEPLKRLCATLPCRGELTPAAEPARFTLRARQFVVRPESPDAVEVTLRLANASAQPAFLPTIVVRFLADDGTPLAARDFAVPSYAPNEPAWLAAGAERVVSLALARVDGATGFAVEFLP